MKVNLKNISAWTVILIVLNVMIIMIRYGYLHNLVQPSVPTTEESALQTASSTVAAQSSPSQPSLPGMRLACLEESYSNAIALVRPAAVNISADVTRDQRGTTSSGTGLQFEYPAASATEQKSIGSGAIIDSRGYIVTNYHVIAGATDIRVTTFGYQNSAYIARVVEADIKKDLAVLKIDADQSLPTATLGSSAMSEVGDVVLAIGSPYGLEQTVTLGIVSDNKRTLVIDGRVYEDMMQTDAAINKGNSGGPLVNINGEIIGINTAIYAPTGVFNGLGFAIPIDQAKPLIMRATHLP